MPEEQQQTTAENECYVTQAEATALADCLEAHCAQMQKGQAWGDGPDVGECFTRAAAALRVGGFVEVSEEGEGCPEEKAAG